MPLFDSAKGDISYGTALNLMGASGVAASFMGLASLALPSSTSTIFGGGTGTFLDEGNLYRYISAGISPAATGTDNVLAVYTLLAGSFDIAGRGVNFVAQGNFAANSNNKRVKIFVGCTAAVVGSTVSGGTAIADSGTLTTSGAGWALEANLFKYGATGSNTQIGIHQSAQAGSTIAALLSPQALTLTESLPIIIAITGNAATAVSDIVLNFAEVNAMN